MLDVCICISQVKLVLFKIRTSYYNECETTVEFALLSDTGDGCLKTASS